MSIFHRRRAEKLAACVDPSASAELAAGGGICDEGGCGHLNDLCDPRDLNGSYEGCDEAADSAEGSAGESAGDAVQAQEELEREWREAVSECAECWPQLADELPRLLGAMAEIARSYGDESLWQRSPRGLMRQAAIELYGMPRRDERRLLREALQLAGDELRREAAEQSRIRGGLSARPGGAPAPADAGDELVRAMARAKKHGIF